MKEEIIKISKKEDIDLIGFCNIHNLIIDETKYKKQEELNYKCSFQVGDITDKNLTKDIYKDYNIAIVIGVKYKLIKCTDECICVSSCAQGEDYHILLRKKLEKISEYLKKKNYISKIYVDNNPLDERLLAYNAGLGFFGKNNLLINEKIGSSFFIGVILTDAVIEPSSIKQNKCIDCNMCIKACPTNSITENGLLNQNTCLSYITSKKQLTENEEKLLNNCVYGCDKCINICPYNKNNIDKIKGLNPKEILNMTEQEFKEKYSNRAFYWRGKKVIDRNIIKYLENKK